MTPAEMMQLQASKSQMAQQHLAAAQQFQPSVGGWSQPAQGMAPQIIGIGGGGGGGHQSIGGLGQHAIGHPASSYYAPDGVEELLRRAEMREPHYTFKMIQPEDNEFRPGQGEILEGYEFVQVVEFEKEEQSKEMVYSPSGGTSYPRRIAKKVALLFRKHIDGAYASLAANNREWRNKYEQIARDQSDVVALRQNNDEMCTKFMAATAENLVLKEQLKKAGITPATDVPQENPVPF